MVRCRYRNRVFTGVLGWRGGFCSHWLTKQWPGFGTRAYPDCTSGMSDYQRTPIPSHLSPGASLNEDEAQPVTSAFNKSIIYFYGFVCLVTSEWIRTLKSREGFHACWFSGRSIIFGPVLYWLISSFRLKCCPGKPDILKIEEQTYMSLNGVDYHYRLLSSQLDKTKASCSERSLRWQAQMFGISKIYVMLPHKCSSWLSVEWFVALGDWASICSWKNMLLEKHAVFQCVASVRLCESASVFAAFPYASDTVHSQPSWGQYRKKTIPSLNMLGRNIVDFRYRHLICTRAVQPLCSTLVCIRGWSTIGCWSPFWMDLPSYW